MTCSLQQPLPRRDISEDINLYWIFTMSYRSEYVLP